MESEILTPKEIGKLLKIGEPSVRQMVFHKKIPYFKIGRRLRFNKEEVLAHFMKVSDGKEVH